MPQDVGIDEPLPGLRYVPMVTPKSTTSLLLPRQIPVPPFDTTSSCSRGSETVIVDFEGS